MENSNLILKLQQIEEMDIYDLIGLNSQVKENLIGDAMTVDDNFKKQVAKTWFDSGLFILKRGKLDAAEICFFMAYNYNRNDFEILRNLILVYANNGKYSAAINFLDNLYNNSNGQQSSIFWEMLTQILPHNELQIIVEKIQTDPLEYIVTEFCLEQDNPMTWLTIGYTLKLLDHLILANQAIDNALALRIIQT